MVGSFPLPDTDGEVRYFIVQESSPFAEQKNGRRCQILSIYVERLFLKVYGGPCTIKGKVIFTILSGSESKTKQPLRFLPNMLRMTKGFRNKLRNLGDKLAQLDILLCKKRRPKNFGKESVYGSLTLVAVMVCGKYEGQAETDQEEISGRCGTNCIHTLSEGSLIIIQWRETIIKI